MTFSRGAVFSPATVSAAGGPAPGDPVFTPTANPAAQDQAFGGSGTVTFSSVSSGSAVAGRIVVVGVFAAAGSGIASVSYAGNAMTRVAANGTAACELWYVVDAVNATGNVVVAATGGANQMGECIVCVGSITDATAAPTDNEVEAFAYDAGVDKTLTIDATGVGIVAIGCASTPDPTQNGFTEHYDTVGTSYRLIFGAQTASGSWNPTASNTANGMAMAAACWGP